MTLLGKLPPIHSRTSMADPIALVVALKHPLFAAGVRGVLSQMPEVQIVAECSTLAATARALKRFRPPVLITGTGICNGTVAGIAALTHASPDTRVALICLTAGEFEEHALFEGARAVLPPDTAPEQLVECVRTLAAGKRWRAPLRLHAARATGGGGASPIRTSLGLLSARERQIAAGIISGKRNREIADALGISPATVKVHVSRIFEKLGVSSRLAALKKLITEEHRKA